MKPMKPRKYGVVYTCRATEVSNRTRTLHVIKAYAKLRTPTNGYLSFKLRTVHGKPYLAQPYNRKIGIIISTKPFTKNEEEWLTEHYRPTHENYKHYSMMFTTDFREWLLF